MTNDSPERGWWLATDGEWYPPEQHPDYGARISVVDSVEEATDDVVEQHDHHQEEDEQSVEISEVSVETSEVDEPDAPELPSAPTVEHHVIGLDPSAALGDQLLELSNRRVAGYLSDEQFAEAQRQLLAGD